MCAAQAFVNAPDGASGAMTGVLLFNQISDIEALCKLLKERLAEVFGTDLTLEETSGRASFASKSEGSAVGLAEISDILCGLGMPTNLLGYQYLRHAIRLAAACPELLRSVTKELYPRVADEFGTTASCAERAMRHAIEIVWERGNLEALQACFGYSVNPNRGKPTNSEFISKIADNLALENEKLNY